MNLQLLKGTYSKQESLNLLTKLFDVKIKFQEDKIKSSDNEEDIKMRESRIKELQKNLYEARIHIEKYDSPYISLHSEISV
ncbi:MAG: hypothetical protein H7282_05350 [Cytophagaceae bacterium]|nr:hypothetical protein [Cytophagaceae bacterium]